MLVSLRLTALLLRRRRERPAPGLLAWAGSLAAFALGQLLQIALDAGSRAGSVNARRLLDLESSAPPSPVT